MLFDLIYYFKGYIIIKLRGYDCEKLINFLIRSEVEVWDISQEEDYFKAKLGLGDFKKIRKVVREIDCQVSIETKVGFPFLLARLKNRKAIAVGASVAILTIYILSSFIWMVELEGLEEISEGEIISLLEQAGFEYGVLKYNLDLEVIEDIIDGHPNISWVDVQIKGAKLLIEVAERDLLPKQEFELAHIVAKKPALIQELIVLEGQAVAKEGEMVQAGEKLISGEVKIYSQPEEDLNVQEESEQLELVDTKRVVAEGIVKARVWYAEEAELSLNKFYEQETTEIVNSLKLRYQDREFKVYGPDSAPFANFKVEEELKSLPAWRNIDFPIEIVRRRYIKVQEFNEFLDYEQAQELARQEAVNKISNLVAEDAEIIDRELEVLSTTDDTDSARVKVLITTEEEIGELKNVY